MIKSLNDASQNISPSSGTWLLFHSKPDQRLIFFISLKCIIIDLVAQTRNLHLHLGWVGTSIQGYGEPACPPIAASLSSLCKGCSVTLPWLFEYNTVFLGQANNNNHFIYWGLLCARHLVSHVLMQSFLLWGSEKSRGESWGWNLSVLFSVLYYDASPALGELRNAGDFCCVFSVCTLLE